MYVCTLSHTIFVWGCRTIDFWSQCQCGVHILCRRHCLVRTCVGGALCRPTTPYPPSMQYTYHTIPTPPHVRTTWPAPALWGGGGGGGIHLRQLSQPLPCLIPLGAPKKPHPPIPPSRCPDCPLRWPVVSGGRHQGSGTGCVWEWGLFLRTERYDLEYLCMPGGLPVSLYVFCLPVCMYVCLSVCLSVCQYACMCAFLPLSIRLDQ